MREIVLTAAVIHAFEKEQQGNRIMTVLEPRVMREGGQTSGIDPSF